MSKAQIKALVEWIESTTAATSYGEVSLTIRIHNSKIQRIIKTVSESEMQV